MKKNTLIFSTIAIILVILVLGIMFFSPAFGNADKNPNKDSTKENTPPMPPTPIKTYNIEIKDMQFSPSELTIKKGDKVTWTNKDSAPHTVTSDSGSELDSASLSTDETYSNIFNAAETYAYHCKIHPSMKGKIIVK